MSHIPLNAPVGLVNVKLKLILTLSSGIYDLYKAHSIIDYQLLPIGVFYSGIVGLGEEKEL